MFGKKGSGEKEIRPFDKAKEKVVLRSSICNGEKVIGFKALDTGHFEEVMCIRSRKDMDAFLSLYGIMENEIKQEW